MKNRLARRPDSIPGLMARPARWLLPMLLGFGIPFPPTLANDHRSLVINEFLAINDSGLLDEDGEASDWLELRNHGRTPISLGEFYLTDNTNTPLKWQLPDLSLPPGHYFLVILSGKDRRNPQSQIHANFALNGEGEYLALVSGEATPLQEFNPFPPQKKDRSFGLSPHWKPGSPHDAFLQSFARPTPGTTNADLIVGNVDPVQFNRGRGWQDAPFDLKLHSETDGATLYYTTDGTTPGPTNGEVYRSPIQIDSTTTIRAAAFLAEHRPSPPATRSFLFLDDILRQSPEGLPPKSFPYSWGENKVNYGMDPRVVDDPRYAAEFARAFRSIPSISIVMDLDDLFHRERGIYSNAEEDGREWERPCSVEWIHSGNVSGFQIDCGIRIRGGFSRSPRIPKHSFRLFFRKEYGAAKLRYPLFGDSGAREFDHIDLRSSQNNSWHQNSRNATFLRDQFSRDLQLATGQPAARGDYYHLYLNGHYWGLYNSCERIKASYGTAYFGGKKNDFDSIKKGYTYLKDRGHGIGVMANDGNLEAWEALWRAAKAGLESNEAYFKILGRNPDGTENLDYECLLDPTNLIDYMLVIFYTGNYDSPVSAWGRNFGPNNWYGIRNRKSRDGFRFFVWDAEHTFKDVREDRTGPFPAGNSFGSSNPQWIWQQCLENEEFRVLAGDRIQRHFFGTGALTPDAVQIRFLERARGIHSAVIGESARWGDASYTPSGGRPHPRRKPRNRDDNWVPEIDRIAHRYIPARTEIVLAQLFRHGLIPDVPVPEVLRESPGIRFKASRGRVFYTTDGTDPRAVGGGIAPGAREFSNSGKALVDSNQSLKARTRYRGEWSSLVSYQ